MMLVSSNTIFAPPIETSSNPNYLTVKVYDDGQTTRYQCIDLRQVFPYDYIPSRTNTPNHEKFVKVKPDKLNGHIIDLTHFSDDEDTNSHEYDGNTSKKAHEKSLTDSTYSLTSSILGYLFGNQNKEE